VPFQIGSLWKTRVEPKVKIFDWTDMHKKILMADNLAARGIQHNPLCPLCGNHPEDTDHLLIDCSFNKEVLRLLWAWYQFQGTPTSGAAHLDPANWLASNVARANRGYLRLATGILLYAWWNFWKEWNRRIFQSMHQSEFLVACAAKEEIEQSEFLVLCGFWSPVVLALS
jgi:hypothetical protein